MTVQQALRLAKAHDTWDTAPTSVDVDFLTNDGRADQTQLDLWSENPEKELEGLWAPLVEELDTKEDRITGLYAYGHILGNDRKLNSDAFNAIEKIVRGSKMDSWFSIAEEDGIDKVLIRSGKMVKLLPLEKGLMCLAEGIAGNAAFYGLTENETREFVRLLESYGIETEIAPGETADPMPVLLYREARAALAALTGD